MFLVGVASESKMRMMVDCQMSKKSEVVHDGGRKK